MPPDNAQILRTRVRFHEDDQQLREYVTFSLAEAGSGATLQTPPGDRLIILVIAYDAEGGFDDPDANITGIGCTTGVSVPDDGTATVPVNVLNYP